MVATLVGAVSIAILLGVLYGIGYAIHRLVGLDELSGWKDRILAGVYVSVITAFIVGACYAVGMVILGEV